MNRPPGKSKFICYCNGIPRATVEDAIRRGCDTLGKVFDATTAGCGPCGGSCQPELRKMLDDILKKQPKR